MSRRSLIAANVRMCKDNALRSVLSEFKGSDVLDGDSDLVSAEMNHWDKPKLGKLAELTPIFADCVADHSVRLGDSSLVMSLFIAALNLMNNDGDLYPELIFSSEINQDILLAVQVHVNNLSEFAVIRLFSALVVCEYVDLVRGGKRTEGQLFSFLNNKIR